MGDTEGGADKEHVVSKLRLVALGGAIVLALGGAGCGGDSVSSLSGSIRIDGSSTVAPLTRAMAKRFMAEHSDVRISVGASGTDRGFARLCGGETDANDADDRIDARMSAACERAGVAWGEIPVVNDAVVLIVAPAVPVRCLTTDQLEQIWHGNSEVTDSWSQVDDLDPPWDGDLNAWGTRHRHGGHSLFFTKAVNHNEGETRDYNNTLHGPELTIPGMPRRPRATSATTSTAATTGAATRSRRSRSTAATAASPRRRDDRRRHASDRSPAGCSSTRRPTRRRDRRRRRSCSSTSTTSRRWRQRSASCR